MSGQLLSFSYLTPFLYSGFAAETCACFCLFSQGIGLGQFPSLLPPLLSPPAADFTEKSDWRMYSLSSKRKKKSAVVFFLFFIGVTNLLKLGKYIYKQAQTVGCNS